MNKRDLSYEEMCHDKVYEQSEVPAHNQPFINKYEEGLKGAFNQSGLEKGNKK